MRRTAAAALLAALALTGCDRPPATDDAPTDETSAAPTAGEPAGGNAPDAEPAEDEGAVTVKILSWDQTQQLVADHRGQVVVLDLWSTSCLPCIREFPNLVALHREHHPQVACMSVSLDYIGLESPEAVRDDVLAFLTEQEAAFENVICSDPDQEVYEEIDLASIPAVFVYDRQGRLRERFDNDERDEEFTYERDVIPLVEQLLAEE